MAVDAELLHRGYQIEHRYKLSWWDSLVVAAAQLQGCATLLTEDLQNGADFGVLIVNPFTDAVREDRATYRTSRRFRPRGRPKR